MPDWLTTDIKYAINQRDYFKSKGNFEQYKIWRNKVKTLIKTSKKTFFTEKINNNRKNDPKSLWKNLKDLSGTSVIHPTNFINDDQGNPISDPVQTANTFNDYFINIFQCMQLTLPEI
jgi:hypothetical protein